MFVEADDFIVMVVGGPTRGIDFHVDPYEEWFYQYRGSMFVRVMTDDGPEDVHIREGEMAAPPTRPTHRSAPETGSIGIVLERIRKPGTLEKFQWYCPNCHALSTRSSLQVSDIVGRPATGVQRVLRR